jgi:hypothetical protein
MFKPENKIDDLITDLLYLRKGSGFVAGRIYNANVFISVIEGKNQVFEHIKMRFVSALDSLADKQNAEALKVAYGLFPGYENIPSLKERRSEYGKQAKRKYDTLSDRENSAIEELAVRLLTALYSGAPLPEKLPIPHGSYLIEYIHITTLIRNRRFIEHQQIRKVVALASGIKEFGYHSNEHTRLIPTEGTEIQTRYVKNGSVHTCVYPNELARGETHTFGFKEISDDSPELEQNEDFSGQSFETPTLVYRQKVIFEGECPSVIWTYDKLSRIERPGEPSNKNRIYPNQDGFVQKEFTQLYGGLFAGIAWRWG